MLNRGTAGQVGCLLPNSKLLPLLPACRGFCLKQICEQGEVAWKKPPSILGSLFLFSNSKVEEDGFGEPMLKDNTLGINFHAGKKKQ